MSIISSAGYSVAALQSAYPNYYLDTKQFLEAVQPAIGIQETKE